MSWGLLSLIMIVFYAPFHIMSAAILAIILTSLCIGMVFYNGINTKATADYKFNVFWALPVLLVIWLIDWIGSFSIFEWSISNFINLSSLDNHSFIDLVSKTTSYAQLYGYNIEEYILKTQGIACIFLFLGLASIVPLYMNIKSKKDHPATNRMLIIYLPVVALLSISAVMMFQKSDISPLRVIVFMMIFCTILSAYMLSGLVTALSKIKKRFLNVSLRAIIGAIIIIIYLNGVLILYPSTFNWMSTFQSTKSEIDTMQWILNKRTITYNNNILTIIDDPDRYFDLFSKDKNIVFSKIERQKIPWHFDYLNNSSLGSYYKNPVYLVLSDQDRSYYRDLFPRMAPLRFNESDYIRLEIDRNLTKIYCTKETVIYGLGH
jgi:hypothetical protein